jgi:hypothetical protein
MNVTKRERMTKVTIEVEFEVEDSWGANSYDSDEKDWFWNEVVPQSTVMWFSNEVGDFIAETSTFTIKQITFNTKIENN